MTRSIAWQDGAIDAVDQCALPHDYRLLRLRTVDEVIDAIQRLAIRGAPAIGVAGALAVALSARAHTSDGVCDEIAVRAEAQRIADARPTAVNLSWAVRRVIGKLGGGADAMLAEALEILTEDEQRNRAAADQAADVVARLCGPGPLRLLTHCNTGRLATVAWGTALGAIRVLAGAGRVATARTIAVIPSTLHQPQNDLLPPNGVKSLRLNRDLSAVPNTGANKKSVGKNALGFEIQGYCDGGVVACAHRSAGRVGI